MTNAHLPSPKSNVRPVDLAAGVLFLAGVVGLVLTGLKIVGGAVTEWSLSFVFIGLTIMVVSRKLDDRGKKARLIVAVVGGVLVVVSAVLLASVGLGPVSVDAFIGDVGVGLLLAALFAGQGA